MQPGKRQIGNFLHQLKGSQIFRDGGRLDGRLVLRLFLLRLFFLSFAFLLSLGICDGLLRYGTGQSLAL